jgi:hypothetical protein
MSKEFRRTIVKCLDCPSCKGDFDGAFCDEFPIDIIGNNLENLEVIPFWCPLPDLKEGNNGRFGRLTSYVLMLSSLISLTLVVWFLFRV